MRLEPPFWMLWIYTDSDNRPWQHILSNSLFDKLESPRERQITVKHFFANNCFAFVHDTSCLVCKTFESSNWYKNSVDFRFVIWVRLEIITWSIIRCVMNFFGYLNIDDLAGFFCCFNSFVYMLCVCFNSPLLFLAIIFSSKLQHDQNAYFFRKSFTYTTLKLIQFDTNITSNLKFFWEPYFITLWSILSSAFW